MAQGQQPAAQGITQKQVSDALLIVADRLKGTVALVDDPEGQPSAHIEILVSDHRDVPRVQPILRALDPQVKVRVVKEADWPDNVVRVV